VFRNRLKTAGSLEPEAGGPASIPDEQLSGFYLYLPIVSLLFAELGFLARIYALRLWCSTSGAPVTAANALETLRASRMNEETTASGSCGSLSSRFLILLLMSDFGSFRALAAAVRLFNSTALTKHSISLRLRIFALEDCRKRDRPKQCDRSGDDKIGSRVTPLQGQRMFNA
jgi:hypothetical protein